jgi:putative phosphoesterase
MRIAVFSDIHGNCLALDEALRDMEGQRPVDRMVCLGDAIQGGPQPAETVARLRELACPVVMGNADAWLLSGEHAEEPGLDEERLRKMSEVREWSLSKLSEADRNFIRTFQPTVEIELEGEVSLLCFHGSPASYDDIILPWTPDEKYEEYLGAYRGRIMTGGHTHMPQVRRIGQYFFFNPGSIGVAYDSHQPEDAFYLDAWAEYAILTSEGDRIGLDFRRVPYNVDDLIRAYKESGRPYAEERIAEYRR